MSWIGMAIGSFIGASRGGILGGIIGAVLGNWVEDKIRGRKERPQLGQYEELTVLAALSAMMAKLAKADGVITPDEVHYCENVFTRLGLHGEKREYCIRTFRQAKNDAHSIYSYAAEFAAVQHNADIRAVVYEVLWELACSDRQLTSAEREILEKITGPLQINPRLYAWQCRRHGVTGAADRSPPEDPYETLGARREMTDDEVRKIYREKAKRLHPDILRAQGLSEELLGRANEQMSRLNAAWDEIKRERGL